MPRDRERVSTAIDQFKIQALNFGYECIKNGAVRAQYIREIQAMSADMMQAYETGLHSAEDAARLAHEMRNDLLTKARAKQTPLGRAYSKTLKEEGKAFEELMDAYAQQRFKKAFRYLDDAEKEEVFIEIVGAAGRHRRSASTLARRLKWGGRFLWVVSAGIALYNIGTAQDKTWASGREAATLGGGFGGGAAAGAVAGIWFGPVGVAVGVAVGGIFGSLLAEEAYLEIAGPERDEAAAILSRHTAVFHMDEPGVSRSLVQRCGINMDQVYVVFLELDANYNGDADDVAYYYVNQIKTTGGATLHALRLHQPLRNLLRRILDDGWTTTGEYQAMEYLRNLRAS